MENSTEHLFSLGTTPTITAIEKLITTRTDPVDTVAFNASTIVRNCMSNQDVQDAVKYDNTHNTKSDKPAKLVIEAFNKEMFTIVNTLDRLFQQAGIINPTIIVYHGEYKKLIPKDLYREPSVSKYNQILAEERLSKTVVGSVLKTTKLSVTTLYNLPTCTSRLPYLYLDDCIRRLRNYHNTAMVTHHYIDCHLGKFCKVFNLVRSFTGDIVPYKNIHNVVFGNNIIPFNVYTHALLGDKEDFKSSLSKKEIDKLKEIAKRDSWILKTSEYIKDALSDMDVRIPFKI